MPLSACCQRHLRVADSFLLCPLQLLLLLLLLVLLPARCKRQLRQAGRLVRLPCPGLQSRRNNVPRTWWTQMPCCLLHTFSLLLRLLLPLLLRLLRRLRLLLLRGLQRLPCSLLTRQLSQGHQVGIIV